MITRSIPDGYGDTAGHGNNRGGGTGRGAAAEGAGVRAYPAATHVCQPGLWRAVHRRNAGLRPGSLAAQPARPPGRVAAGAGLATPANLALLCHPYNDLRATHLTAGLL